MLHHITNFTNEDLRRSLESPYRSEEFKNEVEVEITRRRAVTNEQLQLVVNV